MLAAATTHTSTTTVAVATTGLLRILAHVTKLVAREARASHTDSAR